MIPSALWLFNLWFLPLLKKISGKHMLRVTDVKHFYPRITIGQNRRPTIFVLFCFQNYCHESLKYAIKQAKGSTSKQLKTQLIKA